MTLKIYNIDEVILGETEHVYAPDTSVPPDFYRPHTFAAKGQNRREAVVYLKGRTLYLKATGTPFVKAEMAEAFARGRKERFGHE